MLVNRVFCAGLELGAVVTSRRLFAPIQSRICSIYRSGLVPVLERRLRWQTGDGTIRLIARQSTASGRHFNVFTSDLDLAVVLPDGAIPAQFCAARDVVDGWRGRLPFLGELELHTSGEWVRRRWLEEHGERWLLGLRDVRKIGWIEEALPRAATPYHRNKARRALRLVMQRLSGNGILPWNCGNLWRLSGPVAGLIRSRLGEGVVAATKGELADGPIAQHCPFLNIVVAESPIPSAGLVLPRDCAATLLAVVPTYETRAPHTARWRRLRARIPALAACFAEVVEWESLQFAGYLRSVTSRLPWMDTVADSLAADRAECALAGAFGPELRTPLSVENIRE
jgi:hypothetical protein